MVHMRCAWHGRARYSYAISCFARKHALVINLIFGGFALSSDLRVRASLATAVDIIPEM